jgi:hypothetical protein
MTAAAPPQVLCPVCTGSRQAPGGACEACHVTGSLPYPTTRPTVMLSGVVSDHS